MFRIKIKYFFLIIIIVTSNSLNLIPQSKNSHTDLFIEYNSKVFYLLVENKTYYDIEKFDLYLRIDIQKDLRKENLTIKLEITNKKTEIVALSVENVFTFYEDDRSIFEGDIRIGIIPLFSPRNLTNGKDIVLSEFGNDSVSGYFQDIDRNRTLINREIPFHYFVVCEDPYAEWHYADYSNILLSLESFDQPIPLLFHLFNITEFVGELSLYDTNYEIGQYVKESGENDDLNKRINILPFLIIISIVVISFFLTFIVIRRKLIDLERQKKRRRRKRR